MKRRLKTILWILIGSRDSIINKMGVSIVIIGLSATVINKYSEWFKNNSVLIITICIVVIFIEVLREQCFAIWWQVKKTPKSIFCPICHKEVKLRVGEPNTKFLRTFPGCILPHIWEWHDIMVVFFHRPRLHLHCPHCGLDEIVCPYCDQPISEDDKKCPHCGKRVL